MASLTELACWTAHVIGVGKVQCVYQFSVNAFSISDKAIEGNKQLIFCYIMYISGIFYSYIF